MAVQLEIHYETLMSLVDQLPEEDRHNLLMHLLTEAKAQHLTSAQRLALFDTMTVDLGTVSPNYSDRREDWYGNDER